MSLLKKPDHVIEIFLQPGELYFGDAHTRIRTILGSCVAVTLWHPSRRIGGMCHYMLPTRVRGTGVALDGRYGDEALDMLVKEMKRAGTRPREYEAKLFGGGHMFGQAGCATSRCGVQVPDRNAAAGRSLAKRHGLRVRAEQLGGHGHREVIFDVWSGHAWVRHAPLPPSSRCRTCEAAR